MPAKQLTAENMVNLAVAIGVGLLTIGILAPIGLDLLNASKWFNTGTAATVVSNLPTLTIVAVLLGIVAYFSTKK